MELRKNIDNIRSLSYKNVDTEEDPKSFFSNDILKDKNYGPRFDDKMNLIPYSVIGSKDLFEKSIQKRLSSLGSIIATPVVDKINSSPQISKGKENKQLNSVIKNIIKIENNDIIKMYNKIKKRIETNEENRNDNLISQDNLPMNVKETLKKQEYLLNYNVQSNKKRDHLNNYIGKKSKKKENELLVNSSPDYLIKSEIMRIIDSKQNVETSLNLIEWIKDLRSKPNDPFIGTYFINGGSQFNPLWSRRKSKVKNKSVEFIRPSISDNLTPNEKFKTDKFVKESVHKYKINLENLLNLDKIKVEGKNLLEEENRSNSKMRGRKVLHKENPCDFINETIQLDYLSKKDRNYNDLSFIKYQKS